MGAPSKISLLSPVATGGEGLADSSCIPCVVVVVNHSCGELVVIYEDQLYRFQEARQLVVDAYDRQLAEQCVF